MFLIPFMLRFLSLLLLGLCPCVVSVVIFGVSEFVVVSYVDTVVAVTVMRVLLFVLRVCMLRKCEGTRVTAMMVWGMDEVCAWHVCGTRGSGIVSSAADMLWMNVVHGMRGVGGICEICMCWARGGVGREGVTG